MAIEFREVSGVMSRVTETFLCTRLLDADEVRRSCETSFVYEESAAVEFREKVCVLDRIGGTGVASKSLCR